ncbi:MAG: outer membrane lipoprotein-sorting protein [Ichthyobacteriaceae bacterium]|nr:outer membrane lipoprotein-sorting protein [Ichthyobacteriaceae bacterium]
MKKTVLLLVTLFLSVAFTEGYSQEITAELIIKKADELTRGKTNKSEMTMEIIRPTWKRSVSMKSWSRGTNYSMTYITAPSKDKGQVFLKRDTEMWNWIPSIGRMMKIPSSMMSQGWMGSDYSNDDILKESSIVNDYVHKIVSEEKIDGYDTYKIEMTPKEEAAVVWGKVYKWIIKDKYIQIKSEYYDEDMDLIKSDISSDFKIIGGRFLPSKIEIIPTDEPDQKTVIHIKNITFDVDLPESFFSQQKMKRIR